MKHWAAAFAGLTGYKEKIMRTRGQERAEFALQEVYNAVTGMKDKAEFKSFTAGVPSMILMNGFGQTLAFMVAKKDDKYIKVLSMIKRWLVQKGNINAVNNDREFIMKISGLDQKKYLEAQNETMALLEWVKRFAAMEAK